jgi:NAD(P)H-dependent FMN reductase
LPAVVDDGTVRFLGLCGSLRPDGFTRMALSIALAGAQEKGAAVELVDLRDYGLSFCTGETQDASQNTPGVQRLRQRVREASCVILATPNYHATLSGVLKNALDLMSAQEFKGKVVANTLNTLRAIGRTQHAWVIPWEAWVYHASSAFAADGGLGDAAIEERQKEVGRRWCA